MTRSTVAEIQSAVEEAFREEMHPRDRVGRWIAALNGLKAGGKLRVGGVSVARTSARGRPAGFRVTGGGKPGSQHASAADAAQSLEARLGAMAGASDEHKSNMTDFDTQMASLSGSPGPALKSGDNWPSPRRRQGLLATRTAAGRALAGIPLDPDERAALDWWQREGKGKLTDSERKWLGDFQFSGSPGTQAMLNDTVPHPSSVSRAPGGGGPSKAAPPLSPERKAKLRAAAIAGIPKDEAAREAKAEGATPGAVNIANYEKNRMSEVVKRKPKTVLNPPKRGKVTEANMQAVEQAVLEAFEASLHPRDREGRWLAKIAGLRSGGSTVMGGVTIRKDWAGHHVSGGSRATTVHADAKSATRAAIARQDEMMSAARKRDAASAHEFEKRKSALLSLEPGTRVRLTGHNGATESGELGHKVIGEHTLPTVGGQTKMGELVHVHKIERMEKGRYVHHWGAEGGGKSIRGGKGFGGDSALLPHEVHEVGQVDFNHHVLWMHPEKGQQVGLITGANSDTHVELKPSGTVDGKAVRVPREHISHIFQSDGSGYRKLKGFKSPYKGTSGKRKGVKEAHEEAGMETVEQAVREAFDEHMHPRDRTGKFAISGLKVGHVVRFAHNSPQGVLQGTVVGKGAGHVMVKMNTGSYEKPIRVPHARLREVLVPGKRPLGEPEGDKWTPIEKPSGPGMLPHGMPPKPDAEGHTPPKPVGNAVQSGGGRYTLRNEAALAKANNSPSARSHWDNAPNEPGVVGGKKLGASVEKQSGKVNAVYYRANGSLRQLGDFSSHEEAHKAIVKASVSAARRRPKGKVSEAVAEVVAEAADSMAKASTPEPFSTSKTSNWVARTGGLPPYIQHVAHDLMEKRGMTESRAIQMAIGIIKNWAHGKGKVHPDTRAAAAKALAEWSEKKARAKAT